LDAENISLLVAFGAGVLSFLSPCVLPMVPIYVAYMAGSSLASVPESRRWATLANAVAFGLGFSLVFVTFWASIGLVGYLLQDFRDPLRQLGGVVLIVFGLHQTGILRIPLLYRQLRMEREMTSAATPLTSLLLGVAFAAGWTPCVGPILGGIIGLASMSETVWKGTYLLIAYSLGLGLPFVATALAISQATALLQGLRKRFKLISITSGILLIGIGLLMLFDTFKLLPQYFNWGAI
jgi:cytochrome c-type biogenesis protein